MTVAAQAATDVVILRHQYKFGIDQVFAAWSDPHALAQWFGPHLMDSFVLTACPLLELCRTDVTKITMTTFSIVKTFDVIKYISLRFVSR